MVGGWKYVPSILVSSIMAHADNHNILNENQHGFRKYRSCETQLIEFTADIIANMEDGKQTDTILLDFSKAFDKVGHNNLLQKLKHYGIRGKTLNVIASFLSERTQRVVLEGVQSYEGKVISGVPQGSVLGPALFLFYINDIATEINSSIRLFADDTIMYLAVTSTNDAEKLQSDLTRLETWETQWEMEFHPNKCQVITFTRKRDPLKFNYTLHGISLEHVTVAKYLGVTFTSDLRWNAHISSIAGKASSTLGFLRRNLQLKNKKLKETAYFSLVRPKLEYAAPVWDPYTQNCISRLEKVQRTAARYVTNTWDRRASVTALLQQLKWKSLETRRKNQRLITFYKMHNHVAALNLNFRHIRPISTSTRNAHSCQYLQPTCNTDYSKFSFYPRTTKEWNMLPDDLVTSN